MPDKPVVAQRSHALSKWVQHCQLVSMRSIENAAVLRWIPYGDGIFADGGSL